MRKRSNQRITKIKRDYVEELLKRAEAMDVADAVSIQPPGSDLIPYPDMNNLRLWTRSYLLKGLNKIYPVKLDTDGQTYMTTLVDGLPLFTKMTKSIEVTKTTDVAALSTLWTNNANVVISADGLATFTDSSQYLSLKNVSNTYRTNIKAKARFKLNSFNAYNRILELGSDYFKFNITSTGQASITNGSGTRQIVYNQIQTNTWYIVEYNIDSNYKATCSLSDDSGLVLGTASITNRAADSLTSVYLARNILGELDLANCSIEVSTGTIDILTYTQEEHQVVAETTKPGLWLSNLVQPVSNSAAGSWLRHNLINNYNSENTNVNADTIGNYAYSFYQRGILKRTAGSTHFNEDSYCQHWSPSALGCISHDAIVIPLNNLRSTYTSYQTLVVPYDPDMQRYNETLSKDVQYNFVDNNNNIPVNITQFNGQVVGKDWSYELVFTPNHSGNTEEPTDTNSTGGCVTGTITYYDLNTGITCTQNINSCFETQQGTFNPDLSHSLDNQILPSPKTCTTHSTNCGTHDTSQGLAVHGCGNSYTGGFPVVINSVAAVGSYSCNNYWCWNNYIVDFTTGCSGAEVAISAGGISTKNFTYGRQGTSFGGYLGYSSSDFDFGSTSRKVSITRYHSEPQIEDKNTNIYMNIIDNKALFEAEGLPWTGDCSEPRFEISYSQTPCESNYCTSRLIASNVDIATDGFVSNLVSVQLNG